MEIKNVLKIVIVVIIVALLLFFTLRFVKNKSNESVEHIYMSELLVFKNGMEYEVLLENDTKSTWFRINDEKEQYYLYPREGKSRIKIPDFNTLVGENVLYQLKPLTNYTYSVSMEDGFKYIKFLLDMGFEIKMYVASPTYYEAFLEREGQIKRVVLFTDSMMVGDLNSGANLPELYDYFTTYNYNDYIVNKLKLAD